MASVVESGTTESLAEERRRYRRLFRRLVGYYRPHRPALVFLMAMHVFTVLGDLAGPRVLGWTLDAYVRVAETGLRPVWMLGGLFLATVLFKNTTRFLRGWRNARVGMDILNRFRNQLHAKFLDLPFAYHDKAASGDLIARTSRDIEKLGGFYFDLFLTGIEVFLLFTGAALMCFTIHWQLGVVISCNILFTCMAVLGYARTFRVLSKASADSYDLVTQRIQENISGVRVVKAFGREEKEKKTFKTRLKDYVTKELSAYDFLFRRMPMANHTANLTIPLVLVVGGRLVATEAIQAGDVAMAIFLMSQVLHRMRPLGQLVQFVQEALASAERIFEVLDEPSRITALEPERPLPDGGGALELRDLRFGYAGGEPVLKGLNLSVNAGETVGIIGRTGSGKSTLAALIARFYETQGGIITLDGQDIRHIDPVAYRRAVVQVFQETYLFSLSLRENLTFGRADATDEEVAEAVRVAQLESFVQTLHEGNRTRVGERGVSLSGGQKQRMAIARALIMRPRVLILDDATASVDATTERNLQRALRETLRGTTTLIVSQRIVSVRHCDRIFVLEDGRIAQSGTHEALSEQAGLYRDMVLSQTLQEASR